MDFGSFTALLFDAGLGLLLAVAVWAFYVLIFEAPFESSLAFDFPIVWIVFGPIALALMIMALVLFYGHTFPAELVADGALDATNIYLRCAVFGGTALGASYFAISRSRNPKPPVYGPYED
jgi:hypothetical protein